MINSETIEKAIQDPEIAEELARLKGLFAADPAILELHSATLERCAFLSISLRRLEVLLIQNGFTEEYKNGNAQSGRKRTPEAALYGDFMKLFLSTLRTLRDALGDRLTREPDELLEFFKERWKKDPNADMPQNIREQIQGMDEFELF